MASWSDAKINMMDEKAEEDMKVLIGLSMKVVLDNEMFNPFLQGSERAACTTRRQSTSSPRR